MSKIKKKRLRGLLLFFIIHSFLFVCILCCIALLGHLATTSAGPYKYESLIYGPDE